VVVIALFDWVVIPVVAPLTALSVGCR
jgi:hypothetical protein